LKVIEVESNEYTTCSSKIKIRWRKSNTTRKKENSGGQLAAVGVKPSPLPCLPTVMLAV
jgi:hypothetical protein